MNTIPTNSSVSSIRKINYEGGKSKYKFLQTIKENTEKISVIFLSIIIVIAIVLIIFGTFFSTYTDTIILVCGYTLIISCVLILVLFMNLCLNYRNKSSITTATVENTNNTLTDEHIYDFPPEE